MMHIHLMADETYRPTGNSDGGTGSPGQRFWPGRVGSRVSVCQTRCLTRFWVLTRAFIVALLFLQSAE